METFPAFSGPVPLVRKFYDDYFGITAGFQSTGPDGEERLGQWKRRRKDVTGGPRLINRKEAAEYPGIAESTFSMWVATHKMPAAICGTHKWDKRAIDAKLDEISGLSSANEDDPYDKWMREQRRGEAGTSSSAHSTDTVLWRTQKEKRQAKHNPRLGLSGKLETSLIFMTIHPECDTAWLPGAGQVLLDELIAVGAARLIGTEKRAFDMLLQRRGRQRPRASGGGGGHDRLTGRTGDDTFVFRSFKSADSDRITDFRHNHDKLAFDHAVFSTLKAGDLPSKALFAGTEAHESNDRFIYNKDTGRLYYDDDGTGSHAQRLVAIFDNHVTLTAHDFLLL